MSITAKVIADSISLEGIRLTTFELEYPRFIHAELMTHRMFSRNAASSRAIPVMKQIELIEENLAEPIHWGKHQPGMQAEEELSPPRKKAAQKIWRWTGRMACKAAKVLVRIGAHKQFANRILEPWAHIKVVCTATEFDNFFWLRKHPDAQPEIRELGDCMWDAMQESIPVPLEKDDWHVPYYEDGYYKYWPHLHTEEKLANALAISSSCCAQVSYRRLDDSLEKAQKIYQMLVESKPVHASPFEHQAKVMSNPYITPDEIGNYAHYVVEDGKTHMKPAKNGKFEWWSGNFRGWIQYRQLMDEHTCWDYTDG